MRNTKRRALVLTNEAARHWFRRSLPPHVLQVQRADALDTAANATSAGRWKASGGDWKAFASAYSACFLAVFTFIA